MTDGELAALRGRIKALGAELDNAVIRHEVLITERNNLLERQFAILDTIQMDVLLGTAIRRGANGASSGLRSETQLMPVAPSEWSDARERTRGRQLYRFDSEPTISHSSIRERARSAA